MVAKASALFTTISDILGDVGNCISLDELSALGYKVTGEKFNVVNESGRITYTVHELQEDDPMSRRTVTFCYAYDYPGKCGRVLKDPFSKYKRLHEAKS